MDLGSATDPGGLQTHGFQSPVTDCSRIYLNYLRHGLLPHLLRPNRCALCQAQTCGTISMAKILSSSWALLGTKTYHHGIDVNSHDKDPDGVDETDGNIA